jgi:hypothetical protein
MRDLKTGDLLIRQRDNRAVLVIAVRDSYRSKYGSTTSQRKQYRLLEGTKGEERWVIDTEIAVKYSLPSP